MKKVLSFILTLAMITSLFAGVASVSVSAHQNHKMKAITFDELSESNATGYLYGTGNHTTTDGTYKNMANIVSEGAKFSAGINCNQWHYADVATAPDGRYGKSLLIRERWETGATTVYAQSPLTPTNVLNGTINIKASIYTEKNANDAYIQRAIKLRSTVPSPLSTTYLEQYPVLFSHESSKAISVFGKSTGKSFKTDTWYDMDITYNIDTNQFHAIILENGEDYIDMIGTSSGNLLGNVETVYLYHSPAGNPRNDQKIYWDNLCVQSVNNFKITDANLYPEMDFENLKDQIAGQRFADGLPSTYTYSFGYQGNPELSVLKAVKTDKGTSACVYGTAYPGSGNTTISTSRYQYAQVSIGTSALAQFRLKASVKFDNTKLCGIYLNGQGSAEIMFYDNITAFGKTLFTGYDKTGNVWYDIDLIMDTETGYYDLTMVKTDDATEAHISGFQTKYLTPITEVKFGHDRGSGTAATFVNESFYYIDDLYIGNYTVKDVGAEYTVDFEDTKYPGGYCVNYDDIKIDSLSATAGQFGDLNTESQTDEEGKEVKAEDSFNIPFIQDKPKYTITAKFTLEDLNSNKIVYFGNLPILEILPTGQVKCNQSARPYSEGYLIVGNEYTITHVMQAGCSISSTTVKGVMDVNGTVKESSAGYGSGRPSGPWDPFKIYVKPTGDAEKTSTLTLSDINIDAEYATSSTKNFRVESMANASPKASIFLPHDKASSGYIVEADLCFDNFEAERTIKIGDNTLATIDNIGALTLGDEMATLEAEKVYKLRIDTNHGEKSTATVSLGGVSTIIDASPYINIEQGFGASLFTIDNLRYEAKIPLTVNSESVFSDYPVDSDVTIEFSSALSESVNADSFRVYAPNGKLDDSALISDVSVEFSDDRKSVTLKFTKEKGSHYHITYTAENIYGMSLSDVIEINTELEDIIASPIEFSSLSGDNLTVLPSGEVKAKTTVSTGDGNSYDTYMWGALYDEAGKLCDVKLTPVEVTSEEKEVSVSLNVPGENKAYWLKAGLLASNLKPIIFDEIHTQIIIFKLDDLSAGTYKRHEDITQWAVEENIPLAFGMVCNSIESGNEEYIQSLKNMADTGLIEIWCHGWDHSSNVDADGKATGTSAEFFGELSAGEQAAILLKCVEKVSEATDGKVNIQTFGAPHNTINDETVKALEMVPQYKTMIQSGSAFRESDSFLHLNHSLHLESGTGVMKDLETVKGFYDTRTVGQEYMIYSAHGAYFSDESFDIFKSFAAYLKTKDVAFMTPVQYYNFIK